MSELCLTHDGVNLTGYFDTPAGEGPFPAVLVMHSALGLGDNERKAAERLRECGYATLLIDMFGDEFDGDMAKAGQYFAALQATPATIRSRAIAWFEALAARPEIDAGRVASIGYCFGGTCVMELARSGANVKASVSLHGILSTHAPAKPGAVTGDVVAWCGEDDPYSPPEQVEAFRVEMHAAGARCQITTFGQVVHAFADPVASKMGREGIAFDARADAVSWAGTMALLGEVLDRR